VARSIIFWLNLINTYAYFACVALKFCGVVLFWEIKRTLIFPLKLWKN